MKIHSSAAVALLGLQCCSLSSAFAPAAPGRATGSSTSTSTSTALNSIFMGPDRQLGQRPEQPSVGTRQRTGTPPGYDALSRPGTGTNNGLARVAPPSGRGNLGLKPLGDVKNVDQDQRRQPRDANGVIKPTQIQGGSLKTWSFPNSKVESVQVFLRTEGRPLTAKVELWQGPDNTPQQVAVYIEDGCMRPFSAVIGTPRDYPSSISVRNTATMEFPMEAILEPSREPLEVYTQNTLTGRIPSRTVQGGAVVTIPFGMPVQSVAVLLRTDGRPLNARIELLQGPNNNKQVMEIYSEDGLDRPFFTILETPGVGNVVRVVNTATMEFPITADIQPYMVDEYYDETEFYNSMKAQNDVGKSRSARDGYFFLNMP